MAFIHDPEWQARFLLLFLLACVLAPFVWIGYRGGKPEKKK